MITMNAVVLDRYDAPLKLTTMERPAPGKGVVLVRIKASGVNPLDIKIRSGPPRTPSTCRRPSSASISPESSRPSEAASPRSSRAMRFTG
jgi:NADPH:quinone reductase-like Zn-dependent oxidoreductase